MPLTNQNLAEIKTAVINLKFGFKLPDPSRTKKQELLVYKKYTVTPIQIERIGPGFYRSVYRRSPTEPRLYARNLSPGKKLSPGKYGINNLLLMFNGKSRSSRPANKKSNTSRKYSPSAKR
jgi:hypothetical protein